MRQKMRYKKMLHWLLVMVWMGVIFYFSHQPAEISSSLSGGVMETLLSLLPGNFPIHVDALHTVIRKTAHISVYFLLAIFVCMALGARRFLKSPNQHQSYSNKHKVYIWGWRGIALGICFVYALSDEFHQTFIPGRSGELRDVFIDTSGAIIGLLAYHVVYWWIQNKQKTKKS